MNQLQMATTEELIGELESRHEAMLLVAERQAEQGEDLVESNVVYKGSPAHALGLAAEAKVRISASMVAQPEPPTDGHGEEWGR